MQQHKTGWVIGKREREGQLNYVCMARGGGSNFHILGILEVISKILLSISSIIPRYLVFMSIHKL